MWIQISAGRGPVECARAVRHLAEALSKELSATRCRVEILSCEVDERGGWRSALLSTDAGDLGDLQAGGTVQWIAESSDRPGHRRKNWFVDVAVLPDPPTSTEPVKRRWVIETMRSGGAGGQHVNKTESAVRVTDPDTGLCAQASEERSQHQNRALAFARLAEKIAGQGREAEASRRGSLWERHDQLMRGRPVRIYEGGGFVRRS
ncbi:MAG TPA: peptide chain release factor H [Fibrobacteria bacterium]|nr:peptide chain release factor H [Fibrobacteria bacterium]HOX50608.1 peptide chain release factor H [Fibrobacteria bacterium]